MLNNKCALISNIVIVPLIAIVFLQNPIFSQPSVKFHGGFHLVPTYVPAGDPFTDVDGLATFPPDTVIDNEAVFMMPYRARIRAEITFQEWQTLKANIGFVAANGPINLLPFAPDNINQWRPT